MKYARIVAEFYSHIWAIREDTLMAMQTLLRQHAFDGVKWTAEEIRQRIADANAANGYVAHERGEARYLLTAKGRRIEFNEVGQAFDLWTKELLALETPMEAASGKRNAAQPGSVAVIPVVGIVSHRMSLMGDISGPGGASTQKLTAQLRQALEDGNCKAIVLDVDSPGGSVEGVTELASEIFSARKQKPIKAVCNAMAASAAYWLASAADEVICTPSGQCGSIGAFMLLQDESEALAKEGIKITMIKSAAHKGEGHPTQPLSEDAIAYAQSQVDTMGNMFNKAVAQNRGTSQANVREKFGQGRSFLAADAVKAGLADRVATLDEVLAGFGVKSGAAGSGSRASAETSSESRVASTEPETTHSSPAIAEEKREVFSAKPTDDAKPDDDEDDDNFCGCSCAACNACTGNGGAKADDDMAACACSCSACQNCANKGGAHAPLSQPVASGTPGEQKETAAAAGDALAAIARRRQQFEMKKHWENRDQGSGSANP